MFCDLENVPGMIECSAGFCLTRKDSTCAPLLWPNVGRELLNSTCADNYGARDLVECAPDHCKFKLSDRQFTYCIPVTDSNSSDLRFIGKEKNTH